MVKIAILLLSILITLNAVSYAEFYLGRAICERDKLGSCQFLPVNTRDPL